MFIITELDLSMMSKLRQNGDKAFFHTLACVILSICVTTASILSDISADSLNIEFKQQPSSTISWNSIGNGVFGVVDRKLWLLTQSTTSYLDLDTLTINETGVIASGSIQIFAMTFATTDTYIYYVTKQATTLYRFDPSGPSYTSLDTSIMVQQTDSYATHCLASLKHKNDNLWYLYALGGTSNSWIPNNKIYRYNISNNSWQLMNGTLEIARCRSGCAGIVDSQDSNKHVIYMFGGQVSVSSSLAVNNTVEYCVMDFSVDLSVIECSVLSNTLFESRSRIVSLILNSYLIVLLGGVEETVSSTQDEFATVELLDTRTNTIYNQNNGFNVSLNSERYNFFAAFDNNSDYYTIYVAGGIGEYTNPVDEWEIGCLYDTSSSSQFSFSNTPESYEFDNNINYVCINDSLSIPTSFPTYPTSSPISTTVQATTMTPSQYPTVSPTPYPSNSPSNAPFSFPSIAPSIAPSKMPTETPTSTPSEFPATTPSEYPSGLPSMSPSSSPSNSPSGSPSGSPSESPSEIPSDTPFFYSSTDSATTTSSTTMGSPSQSTTPVQATNTTPGVVSTDASPTDTNSTLANTTTGTSLKTSGGSLNSTYATTQSSKVMNKSIYVDSDPQGLENEIEWNLQKPNIFTIVSIWLILVVISMILCTHLHATYSSQVHDTWHRYGLVRCMGYLCCCCGIINDSVRISSILLFFTHSHSFIIDSIFTIHLYLIGEMELAMISIGALILSFVFSFLVFLYLRNEWISQQDGLRHWLNRYTSFILRLTIFTGSTFPAIELCNSRAFGFRRFKMGLSRPQLNAFRAWKLAILMTVENIPEIYVSLRYFQINNGFDTISLLTLIISVVNLIIDLSMFIVRIVDSSNNDNRVILLAQIEVLLEKQNYDLALPRSQMFSQLRSSFATAFNGKISKQEIEILFVREIMTHVDQTKQIQSDISLSRKEYGFLIETAIEIGENGQNISEVKQELEAFCDKTLRQELQRIWKIGDHKMKRRESDSDSGNTVNIFLNVPKQITLKECKVLSKERGVESEAQLRAQINLRQRKMNDSELNGVYSVGSLSSLKNSGFPDSPSVETNIDIDNIYDEHKQTTMGHVACNSQSEIENIYEVQLTTTKNNNGNEAFAVGAPIMSSDGADKNSIGGNDNDNEGNGASIVYNGEGLEHGHNGIDDNDDDNDDEGDLLYDDKYNSYQDRNVTITGGKRERLTSGEIIDTGGDRKTKHGENSEVDEASLIS